MSHGTIIHGKEVVEAPGIPIGYYHRRSPMGRALTLRSQQAPTRVAVVGLGAGALAGVLGPRDELTFYELDPLVEVLARRHFSYLAETPTKLMPTRTGDARLELRKDPEASYDVILVDAFSSDAIPIHLLTREALELYLSRLLPGGWLILHIPSRYYDLRPVVHATAGSLDRPPAELLQDSRNLDARLRADRYEDPSLVYALAREPGDLKLLRDEGWLEPESLSLPEFEPWSDDYANVLRPLWAYLRQ